MTGEPLITGLPLPPSSSRVIDLNLDGVKDIVFGAGGRECDYSENGVFAIDGTNGEIIWKVEARNQIVGSAAFQDINNVDINSSEYL